MPPVENLSCIDFSLWLPNLLFHDLCPEPAGSPQLGDLLEEVELNPACNQMEREKRSDIIDAVASLQHLLNIGNPGEKRVGDPLRRSGSAFADMGPGDADGIEIGNVLDAVFNGVADEPDRRLGRKDVGPPGDVLLDDIVLNGSPQLARDRRPAFQRWPHTWPKGCWPWN